jgi:hypothetical protein
MTLVQLHRCFFLLNVLLCRRKQVANTRVGRVGNGRVELRTEEKAASVRKGCWLGYWEHCLVVIGKRLKSFFDICILFTFRSMQYTGGA